MIFLAEGSKEMLKHVINFERQNKAPVSDLKLLKDFNDAMKDDSVDLDKTINSLLEK